MSARTAAGASGFTADEKAAMKARAAELKAERKAAKGAAKIEADLQACVAAIEQLPEDDRAIAQGIHEIVLAHSDLLAKTWYGMPAYHRDGAVVCFFQPAAKFGARYGTLGFNDAAQLDDGSMWPTAFAVTSLGAAQVKRITALVKQAAG